MAPELVKKQEYEGDKVDMWAFGVLMYTCLVGCFPFRGSSENELYSRVMRGWYKFPTSNPSLSKEAKSIMQKCLTIDQGKRLKACQLFEYDWILCPDLNLTIFENAGQIKKNASASKAKRN